ncbi:large subunit ribosomal protein L13e [Nannochloropsis gaditana CCMP526]|uniref:large subunit ribosomal protein L13e n=1 Tax=Nannochloropsis gaditana (strain CCMP526) TaxID=1093141 RepID=UPI00029F5B79|nr:large subunit ribosomal protein L13e [Nannochloropsis gaditana CCMP526]EKU22873.1 large subunit ribosomal protein L13e [Nannochloropsis gaditana CCMP526]|eukprot:XP_005853485.1 large subunit ribosomal protein L13e [Nannochloropsis gaditana CCMP526]
MVRHNNVIPNQHFHKDWQTRVKTWFVQPAKKKARRLARKAKAAALAPRPTQLLRPVVHAPTQRYNHKTRLGRGFTMQELKEAGLTKKYAKSVGIAVDHRRTNLSVESLQANVQRLKEYKSKLIVFPMGRVKKPKAGDSSTAECRAAVQATGTVLPLPTGKKAVEFVSVSEELKNFRAHTALRVARNDQKLDGIRRGKALKAGKGDA